MEPIDADMHDGGTVSNMAGTELEHAARLLMLDSSCMTRALCGAGPDYMKMHDSMPIKERAILYSMLTGGTKPMHGR